MAEYKVEVKTESVIAYYVEADSAQQAEAEWSKNGVYTDTVTMAQSVVSVEETGNE